MHIYQKSIGLAIKRHMNYNFSVNASFVNCCSNFYLIAEKWISLGNYSENMIFSHLFLVGLLDLQHYQV